MPQVLLVGNPARRKHKAKRRSAASPAQKRARAKFAAMARSGAFHKHRKTRSNPVKYRPARRRAAAKPHHRRHTRRNPISGASMRSITGKLRVAAFSAAGALGVDVLYGFVGSYLPATMQTPKDAAGATNYAYYLGKGAGAIALGLALRKVMGAVKADHMVQGSLIVTLHDLMKDFVATNVTSVPLGMYPRAQGLVPQRLGGLNPGRIVSQAGRTVGMGGVGEYLSLGARELTHR